MDTQKVELAASPFHPLATYHFCPKSSQVLQPSRSGCFCPDLNLTVVSLLCRPLVWPPGEAPHWTLCVLPPLKDFFFTDLHKSCSPSLSKTVLEPCADLHHQHTRPQLK